MSNSEEQTFEQVNDRLKEIVAQVEDESMPLDDALDLFEEAVKLGTRASTLLKKISLRAMQLKMRLTKLLRNRQTRNRVLLPILPLLPTLPPPTTRRPRRSCKSGVLTLWHRKRRSVFSM